MILELARGSLPTKVQCVGDAWLTPGIADTTLTNLKFTDGLRAHVFVSWLNPFKEQKLTVIGSLGMLVFDDTLPWAAKLQLHRQPVTWAHGQIPTPSKTPGEHLQVTECEPLRRECSHFVECCRDRGRPRTDGHEGLRVLKVLQAAQTSLEREGDAVRLDGSSEPAGQENRIPTTSPSGPSGLPYFAHPTAVVDAGAVIGPGCKIWHFAHVSGGATLGANCSLGQNTFVADHVCLGRNVKVQNNVAIYTGTTIEDDVFLGPSCVLTNVTNPRSQVIRRNLYEKTVIRRGATIGANATVVCGIEIGKYAFVSAGAVVASDVPDYALMMGVPAVQKGWMSRHGHRLVKAGSDGIFRCPESGFQYRETAPGILRCLDLAEDEPLPSGLEVGTRSYDEFKRARPSPSSAEKQAS